MPPKQKMSDAEIADLTKWVAGGAVWPKLTVKIPLGNLFDDVAEVSLGDAIDSDDFKAAADATDLGVDRVVQGWGTETEIAGGIKFDFQSVGSGRETHGLVMNDAWDETGGFDEARAQYWRVLSASPGDPAATAGLALHDIDQRNNLDVVLSLLTAAEPGVARDADIQDALGWVYLHRGMPQRALPSLEAAVRANPRHPRYQHHLGVAYARLGETAKARAALTQAIALEVRAVERTNIEAALAALAR